MQLVPGVKRPGDSMKGLAHQVESGGFILMAWKMPS